MESGFRGLRVYQLSHQLALKVHAMTMSLPKFEVYEEGGQIRRSSKRVSSSIVEGYCLRKHKAEYLQYLHRAHGSAEETIEHLDFLHETGSLPDTKLYEELRTGYEALSRQLYRFVQGVDHEHDVPYAFQEAEESYGAEDPPACDAP